MLIPYEEVLKRRGTKCRSGASPATDTVTAVNAPVGHAIIFLARTTTIYSCLELSVSTASSQSGPSSTSPFVHCLPRMVRPHKASASHPALSVSFVKSILSCKNRSCLGQVIQPSPILPLHPRNLRLNCPTRLIRAMTVFCKLFLLHHSRLSPTLPHRPHHPLQDLVLSYSVVTGTSSTSSGAVVQGGLGVSA